MDHDHQSGTQYLSFSLMMFFVGGILAMLIRAELFQPGMQIELR